MRWSYVPPLFFAVTFLLYWAHTAIYGAARTRRFDRLAIGPWLPRIFLEYGYFLYRVPVVACLRLGVTADVLTWSSIVLCGFAAVLIGGGDLTLGGWTLLLGFTCDGMDGVVARAAGTATRGGELLDSVLDHGSDLFAYLGFAYYYRDHLPMFLLVVLTMVGSSLVSYTRAKGAALGVDTNVGLMRRFERAVWLGGGTVLAPIVARVLEPGAAHPRYHVVVVVMALLAVLTIYTVYLRARTILAALGAR
jgi:CDP-diacylglycerol--glycerol-3-phosphate 3-phosphatidyltransferase